MIRTLFAILSGLSVALVFCGGVLAAAGLPLVGYGLAILGSGWLGILYGGLLRWVGELAGLLQTVTQDASSPRQ